MVVVIFAHPYPDRSRANQKLVQAISGLPDVQVRSLYELYPEFDIDVDAEQHALKKSKIVVWQHPMYWYSVPGMLKHWFDKVLARGWAYGDGGTALHGKRCQWVVTTGGDDSAFQPEGMHAHPFDEFVPHVSQTARFCGMHWEPPIVLQGAHRVPESALEEAGRLYRDRLSSLIDAERERAHV
jgi:glutathione-regulated potassium-efflux system ancillary protein KefF